MPAVLPSYGPPVFMTEPQKSNVLFRAVIAALVGPAFLAWLLPRRPRRQLSAVATVLLVAAIGAGFGAIAWRWGELLPSPSLW
jgi:hypothetical protein